MPGYQPSEIEPKWQKHWDDQHTYRVSLDESKPKYYVLDMFPYPSGAGLHVGHPLGYIASDIFSRYKKLKGFNVLHPMGFDAFGLPAEQYAIETGRHPAVTTAQNIETFKKQLGKIGFCYDWEREIKTCEAPYYKWTQWIFMQLYSSYFDKDAQKALPVETLVKRFEKNGNAGINASCDDKTPAFTATEWGGFDDLKKQEILFCYRLAFLSDTEVNWCPALGSVLANDEVKDGVSERGGYPVERKKMRQWSMRITAYAERLLLGLKDIDWSEPLKTIQENWIGKSVGAEMDFEVKGHAGVSLKIFTTRPDTTFGVTYMSVAPEHPMVAALTTPENQSAVEAYLQSAKARSERDRMSDVKTISGVFTGSYAINPLSGEEVQIWVADYVLSGYGTGAVMAVPASDSRDHAFAKHFGLEIRIVIDKTDLEQGAYEEKTGKMINSGFLNGLEVKEAIERAIDEVEKRGLGKRKVNYKMRDAIFARQRYWGEPVPVYFDEKGICHLIDESELPLVLPEIDQYKPTETGEPPLGRAEGWKYKGKYEYELSTMPGWAGSSWYFLRYMDPQNDKELVGAKEEAYWNTVDLYMGGAEHATGHLFYARFWNMFLHDIGKVSSPEPFKKLINQGMIQGRSSLVYKVDGEKKVVSHGLKGNYEKTTEIHCDVNIVENDVLDIEAFKKWRPEFEGYEFVLEDGKYICGWAVEKMSKRWYNVVNPDDVIARYGADTLRLYEMFLGPLEQFKPWNTSGIDGTAKFLKKTWRLFFNDEDQLTVTDEAPTKEEMKILHQAIKKADEDMERFSFNTSVSSFMICVNELTALKCRKRSVLSDLLVILSPYAPHIAEELWQVLGNQGSVTSAKFPVWNPEYLQEDSFEYPISINGKLRAKMEFGLDMPEADIKREVLASETVQKWLEGKDPKKFIFIKQKIVNVVI